MASRHGQRPLPDPKPILATLGDTGLKEYGGRIREEFHKRLTGTRWFKVVKEMLSNESNIAAPYLLIEMMIRSTNRIVKKNDSGHPQAAEAQEYIEQCLDDMESTIQEIMIEAASAIPWGFSYLEILYKIRTGPSDEPRTNSKYTDGRYGWRDWAPRAQDSLLQWAFSDEGRLLGMWQHAPRRGEDLFIPADRAIHFKFRGSKQNPEGFSFIRPAYTSYYYATNKRMTEAISLERDGAGVPDYQVPPEIMHPNASAEQKAIRAAAELFVKKFRNDSLAGIVRPAKIDAAGNPTGYDFGLVSASGKNIQAYDTSIKRDQHEMLKTFLTQFLAFGISQEGSHALGDSMTSVLGYSVSAINRAIDETITRSAFASLLALERFPPESWPHYESADVEKQKLEVTGAFVSQLLSSGGLRASPDVNDWARQQIGLDQEKEPDADEMIDNADAVVEPDVSATTDQVVDPLQQASGSEMLTVDEAADELRVSRASLMRAIRNGKIAGAKIGNQFRLRRSDIEALFGLS